MTHWIKAGYAKLRGRVCTLSRWIAGKVSSAWATLCKVVDDARYTRWGAMFLEGLSICGIFALAMVPLVIGAVVVTALAAVYGNPMFAGAVAVIFALGFVMLSFIGFSAMCFFIGLRYSDSRPLAGPQPDPSKMFEKLLGYPPGGPSEPDDKGPFMSEEEAEKAAREDFERTNPVFSRGV